MGKHLLKCLNLFKYSTSQPFLYTNPCLILTRKMASSESSDDEAASMYKHSPNTLPQDDFKSDLEKSLTDSLLKLEEIDTNLYRANSSNLWRPVGMRGVFGGQIIGQALAATGRTVPRNMNTH